MAERRRSRQIESSAVAAIGPILVIAPFCVLALFFGWLVVRLVWDIPFWWVVVGYLAGISLRAIEAGNLAARLEALEAVLKIRKDAAP